MRRGAAVLMIGLGLLLGGCATAMPAALGEGPSASAGTPSAGAASAGTPSPAAPVASAAPVVTTKQVTETKPVAFQQVTTDSAKYPKGSTQVTTTGRPGVETIVTEVSYADGVETGRRVVSDEVTTKPVDEVTTVGTYVAPAPKPTATKQAAAPKPSSTPGRSRPSRSRSRAAAATPTTAAPASRSTPTSTARAAAATAPPTCRVRSRWSAAISTSSTPTTTASAARGSRPDEKGPGGAGAFVWWPRPASIR